MSLPINPNNPDLPAYEFVAGGHSLAEIRGRHLGVKMQLVVLVLMAVIFGSCFYQSAKLLFARRSVICSLCLLQAFCGLIFVSSSGLYQTLPSGPTCRQILTTGAISLEVSTASLHSILLSKAYVARNRSRIFLIAGLTLLVMFHPADLYVLLTWANPIVDGTGTCTYLWPDWYPYMKSSFTLTANLVFSWAFLSVVFRQWRQFKSSVWESLARDGLQYYLAVTSSTVICMALTAMRLGGGMSIMIYVLDWGLGSVLMVKHITSIQKPKRRQVSQRNGTNLRTKPTPGPTPMSPAYCKSPLPQMQPNLEAEQEKQSWFNRMADRALHWVMGAPSNDLAVVALPSYQQPGSPQPISPSYTPASGYKRIPGTTDKNRATTNRGYKTLTQKDDDLMDAVRLDTDLPTYPGQNRLSESEHYPSDEQNMGLMSAIHATMEHGVVVIGSGTPNGTQNTRTLSVQSAAGVQDRPRALFSNFTAANVQHVAGQTESWQTESWRCHGTIGQTDSYANVPARAPSVVSFVSSAESDASAGTLESLHD